MRARADTGLPDVPVLLDFQKTGDLLGGYRCVWTSVCVSSRSFSEPVSNITRTEPKLFEFSVIVASDMYYTQQGTSGKAVYLFT